eukprot:TRINITY_DN3226_c0_g3_i2.p1 TRINITY_DN3226_c0_g3~~TRINITY_DN3226_c0_g3_i2.p1  ORF type:complete len:298 (-),score=65.67 TRINITY_DN3226_c0_g3_i2:71-964(-)
MTLPSITPPYKGARHCVKCHDWEKRLLANGTKLEHYCQASEHNFSDCPTAWQKAHLLEVAEIKDKMAEEQRERKAAEAEKAAEQRATKKRKTSINNGLNAVIKGSGGYDSTSNAPPALLEKLIMAVKTSAHLREPLPNSLAEKKAAALERENHASIMAAALITGDIASSSSPSSSSSSSSSEDSEDISVEVEIPEEGEAPKTRSLTKAEAKKLWLHIPDLYQEQDSLTETNMDGLHKILACSSWKDVKELFSREFIEPVQLLLERVQTDLTSGITAAPANEEDFNRYYEIENDSPWE